ncbi:macrolide family glycosyltransferase [Microbacterium yannicii]|uniref:macrolide family glycosyltransferase n=1 Tax=Microbacterium yannicii TaxID=671622 RepID=UPI000A05CB1E|nr:macrolide family glycosyltransferase [Microbacterium yannicii]
MSNIMFMNVAMHGHVNPTLPVVAELVRRGHSIGYWTAPEFTDTIRATGARVHLYPRGDPLVAKHPTPLGMLQSLAEAAQRNVPVVLGDIGRTPPDLIVHGAACPWGLIAARSLKVPAAATFTTFGFSTATPSPTAPRAIWREIGAHPRSAARYFAARWSLDRRYDTRGLPRVDLANVAESLNLVFTSKEFQPHAEHFDQTYRFVGASIGARPVDPTFPFDRLRAPVLLASFGTVFETAPELLRAIAEGLAPLGGSVVLATGRTDSRAIGALPVNVIARRFVPQPDVLARASAFVTHGGMNSVNEALHAGVPVLVIPQGADQPEVARRVVDVGAGLSIDPRKATSAAVQEQAARLLAEPSFRAATADLQQAQLDAGGHIRAADELEAYAERGHFREDGAHTWRQP